MIGIHFHGTADNPKLVVKENDVTIMTREERRDRREEERYMELRELFLRLVVAFESIAFDMTGSSR